MTNGKGATRGDYNALLDDRPRKFGPDEVDYSPQSDDTYVCCSCVHWFINPAQDAKVCEIVRLPTEADIPAQARCKFWTPDGGWLPLIK
jgi:hypothetical protein